MNTLNNDSINQVEKIKYSQHQIKECINKYLSEKNNKIFIANWKMNMHYADIINFANKFNSLIKKDKTLKKMNTLIGIAPTAIGILPLIGTIKKNVFIAAQHVHYEKNGAFTGNISYDQFHEYNVNYALVGHSETRKYLNENDVKINKTIKSLVANKMIPILCIGESHEDYQAGKIKEVLSSQLLKALSGINENDATKIIIAYEPIWAIGTGLIPDNNAINNAINQIRTILTNIFNAEIAKNIHVLYGGSVNPQNAKTILDVDNVDGLLIGNSALDPQNFYQIIISSKEYAKVKWILDTKNGTKNLKIKE